MFSKKYSLIIVILLIIAMSFSGCIGKDVSDNHANNNQNNESASANKNDENKASNQNTEKFSTLIVNDYNNLNMEDLNQYNIDVDFDTEEKMYTAIQKIIYVNNEETPLSEVYFHIYPNTFREKETTPFLFGSFDSAFPNGFEPGYIDIKSISLKDKVVNNFEISGKGKTILRIPFEKELSPKEKIEIKMEYTVKMPPAQDRFGYGEKTFNLGNWYPIAAVYDDEGWNLDPYYSIGDPFYSDTSNYNVTIKAPKDIIIASTGNILSEEVEGNKKKWTIEAKLVRDFAWAASKDFKIIEKDVDGTLVKVYVLNDDEDINNFAAETSYSSIEIFNKIFGKYPYGQYSVVATSFPSGMEYPGIVFIGEKYYHNVYKGSLEIVIAHETGHQWWYSVVGNDEIDEAWLDESLTSYSEVIYADEKYGESVGNNYYQRSVAGRYNSVKDSLPNEIVAKPLSEFENWDDYGSLAYTKGAMFVHAIEEKYGEDTLYNILKEYYKRYRFLNATTEDFVKVCEDITGDDFKALVDEWLYDK